jgi:small GTP-binding protein
MSIPKFKLMLVGDSLAGKTVLYHRIGSNIFNENTYATIGVDFMVRQFEIDGITFQVQIWDTAGQEKFWSINRSHRRTAHCVAVVYSVVESSLFRRVGEIISNVRNDISADGFIVLIGTRCNSPNRVITTEEAEETARGFGIPSFEMDAETGEGVEDGFHTIINEGIQKIPAFFSLSNSNEAPKKERKSSFGSKKGDPETESDSDSDFDLEILP